MMMMMWMMMIMICGQSLDVIRNVTLWQRMEESIFTFHSRPPNCARILYSFQDMASRLLKIANFPTSRVFCVTVGLSARYLASKLENVIWCWLHGRAYSRFDTIQTGIRTPTRIANTALESASSGKKSWCLLLTLLLTRVALAANINDHSNLYILNAVRCRYVTYACNAGRGANDVIMRIAGLIAAGDMAIGDMWPRVATLK